MIIALGDTFVEMPPYHKIAALTLHFVEMTSESKHDMLQSKAEDTRIRPGESFDDYFGHHRGIRSEMQRAEFPLIEHEKVTVKFIVAGLRSRASSASEVHFYPTWRNYA